MENAIIKEKLKYLVNKWKDNIPEKNSDKWWRYRADQSFYLALKHKLKTKK